MKAFVLSFLLIFIAGPLLAYTVPPDVPATAPNPDFPLRVRIFQDRWSYVSGGYEGWGHGDLLGDKPRGFEFTYSCSEPFLHNADPRESYNPQGEDLYQARWKKPEQKLELLMLKVGSDHLHRCELKLALKPVPYGRYGTPAAAPAPGAAGSIPTTRPPTAGAKIQ